jgi:hypothetical protein
MCRVQGCAARRAACNTYNFWAFRTRLFHFRTLYLCTYVAYLSPCGDKFVGGASPLQFSRGSLSVELLVLSVVWASFVVGFVVNNLLFLEIPFFYFIFYTRLFYYVNDINNKLELQGCCEYLKHRQRFTGLFFSISKTLHQGAGSRRE